MMADCGLGDDSSIKISEWKVKKRDIKNKLLKIERKEADVVKLYDDIMTAIFVRIGFYIAFASYLSGFYAKPYAKFWMYTVMVVVILGFIFEVVFPIYSAWMHMRGLENVIQKLVLKREKLHVSCTNLLDDYDAIYLFTSKTKQHKDPFLKELRGHELSRLEDFKKEDKVPKARKKFSRKFPLALGVFCMVYSIIVLLFVFYKSHNQPVLPAPPSLHGPSAEHTLSKTIKGGLESSHRSPQVEATGSKILYLNNLALSVTHADVENLFKHAGKILNVGFAYDREGLYNGFGHVEFATVEGVQNALKLNGQEFFGREIRLDLAQERHVRTPSRESVKSFENEQRSQGGIRSYGGSGSCFVGRLGDGCPGIVD